MLATPGLDGGRCAVDARLIADHRRVSELDSRYDVHRLIEHRSRLLTAVALGGALVLAGAGQAGHDVWRAAVALLAAELTAEVIRTLLLDRHMGVDTIALVAMVGSLPLGQELVVVATPCPLILAAPIAFVSGLSRAARHGVVVKGTPAIEALGQARTVRFDKTGTLTVGTPDVRKVLPADGLDEGELLRLAASVDRLSAHVLGAALAREAQDAGLVLSPARDVREAPGQGISGVVDGHQVGVGSRGHLAAQENRSTSSSR